MQRYVGAGAFGQIWLAVDRNTGRKVAVKFYLHRAGVNWSMLSREVKSLVQLSADRSVVQVLEVGWDAEPPYYVMEWIPGGSLEDRLALVGSLPPHSAIRFFEQILIGLNHCHGKGVLHCDLKPANVLLGDDDEPRLTDFGQSRFSSDQTPALGTLFYMAPEQADLAAAPDMRWDVYAAGAILYRMLSGKAPYQDQLTLDRIQSAPTLSKRLATYKQSIQSAAPPPMRKLPGVDRSLAQILTRCLQPDPMQRYANVQSVLNDLQQRESQRTRRPLILLGLVGPLLILLATTLFAYRSIHAAGDQSVDALRREAFTSNQMAAAFAAASLQSEISRYYDLIHRESERPSLRRLLRETLQDPGVADSLAAIADLSTSADSVPGGQPRETLLDDDTRIRLDEYLRQRLARSDAQIETSNQPRLASLFVTDRHGTIVSIAYQNPVSRDANSAGRNFAYRTYFHGGREDANPQTTSIKDARPLTDTRLSAAFPSTATKRWKVAVSTPIRFDDPVNGSDDGDNDEAKESPVDAIFVATINVNDLRFMQRRQSEDQLAVVVDARPGNSRGTILQHPFFDSDLYGRSGQSMPHYQIDAETMDRLVVGRDVDYRDPVARPSSSQSEFDANFDGRWIAAIEPVQLPGENSSVAESGQADLLVLVQYRLTKVLEPVRRLTVTLVVEAIAGAVSVMLVTASLWFFLQQINRRTRRIEQSGDATKLNETMSV